MRRFHLDSIVFSIYVRHMQIHYKFAFYQTILSLQCSERQASLDVWLIFSCLNTTSEWNVFVELLFNGADVSIYWGVFGDLIITGNNGCATVAERLI